MSALKVNLTLDCWVNGGYHQKLNGNTLHAGTGGRWWFGDKDVELDEHGWHAGNSGGSTREVGLKKPNPWGLYDMNGLVNEWCSDHWAKTYEGGRTQHPHVREGSNHYVVRGGAWFTESDSTRNRSRSFAAEDKISDGLGFRLAWSPFDEQPMADQVLLHPAVCNHNHGPPAGPTAFDGLVFYRVQHSSVH